MPSSKILIKITEAMEDDGRRQLSSVLADHPNLGGGGFSPGGEAQPPDFGFIIDPINLPNFIAAREFLSRMQPTKPWDPDGHNQPGDHWLSHHLNGCVSRAYSIEHRVRARIGFSELHVSTGTLIAAAISLGIPHTVLDPGRRVPIPGSGIYVTAAATMLGVRARELSPSAP